MAKKGGTSEINGFVNIKADDSNKTRQKVSTRTPGSVSNIKNNTSKSIKKEQLDDGAKSTKVTNKDAVENKTKRESSNTKVSQSSSNTARNTKNPVLVNTSKTKKPVKESASKEEVLKSKANEIPPSKRLPTQQKTSNIRSRAEDVSNSKKTLNPTEKRTSLSTSRNTEKVQRTSSKDTKIKSVSKESVSREKKNVLESSKTEVSKKISVIKKTESNKIVEKKISNKNIADKSKISTKNVNVVVKQNSVNRSKPYSNEKDKKSTNEIKVTDQKHLQDGNVSEPVTSGMEVKSSKDDVKSSYRDLIYFEVDVGNSKQSANRTKSARIQSASSELRSVTRQGTFTKDESPNRSESEVELQKEDVSENHLVTTDNSEEVDYEDDFEDYESDFEEYVSESESESGLSSKSETDSQLDEIKPSKQVLESAKPLKSVQRVAEEERKLDSGNYDLSTKPVFSSSVKQKQLDFIKEAITQENTSLFEKRRKIIIPEKEIKQENKVVVLDFFSALKKQEHVQQAEMEKHRSSIILGMIRLHEQKFDIFEGIFSDDDLFEDIYKNKNVAHALSQTTSTFKEEASQTNDILIQNKWTQYPISYHPWTNSSFSFKTFLEDQRGYGGDNLTIDYKYLQNNKYNIKKLNNFIDSASKIILVLLEEEARWRSSEKSMPIANPKEDIGFSDGSISIHTEKLVFLQERPICDIVFSPQDPNIFVSSHRFAQDIEKLTSFADQFFGRSILCVWNMLQPSQPLYLLVASCQISAVTFDSEYDNFVYAGLTDGSVCLWDLNESSLYHKESTAGSMDYLLRTPTFCSSHLAGKDYHQNVIVSIKSIGYESFGEPSSHKFNPTQVVTLDSDGRVVLWIVTPTLSALEKVDHSVHKFDYGTSHWGKFKLVMGKTLNVDSILSDSERKWGLQFLSMNVAPHYESNERKHMKSILVGTNVGNIIHFCTTEDEVHVPVFSNELGNKYAMSVTTIESNPHGFPLFMAGCDDGSIRFYLLHKPEPLKIISFDEDFVYTPIIKIRWSPLGLGLFFVLDKNFSLHLWNICKDGHLPQISVSLKALQAAHFDVTSDDKFVYIVLSVERFKIDIHRLKDKFIPTNLEDEKEFFIKLVKSNPYVTEENIFNSGLSVERYKHDVHRLKYMLIPTNPKQETKFLSGNSDIFEENISDSVS